MYQIPLDTARQDATPHGNKDKSSGGGGPAGGGTGGGSGSGGGSAGPSSGGSGGSGAGGSAGSTGSGSAGGSDSSLVSSQGSDTTPVLVPGGQPGSLVHSSNGFGSSAQVPGANSPASAGLGSVQNNASSAPLLAFLLAAVVLMLGGYVGLRAWRNAAARKGAGPTGGEPPQLPPPTA